MFNLKLPVTETVLDLISKNRHQKSPTHDTVTRLVFEKLHDLVSVYCKI